MTMWMTDGAVAWFGLALELVVAAAYVSAARRRSPRGSCWPAIRTTAFLGGLLVIGVALDSPIAARDDVPSIHVLQHGLLMMLGPLLLALGAPITLAMRSLSRDGRRRLRAVLHDPSVRGLLARPVVLVVDYNAAMALMLVAPVYRLAEHSLVVHIAAHLYLVVCGLLFWTAMLARDPVPGRLPEPSRVRAVAVGVPLNLALAATVALAPWLFIGEPSAAAAQMLVAVTAVTGVLGVVLVPRRRLNAAVVQWLA